jgi:hypothetical protein
VRTVLSVATVSVTISLGLAATCAAQAPAEDSVTGSGSAGLFETFEFDIHSGPNVENPTGQAAWSFPDGSSGGGTVTCLSVHDGHFADFNIQTDGGVATFFVADADPRGPGEPFIPTEFIEAGIGQAPSDCTHNPNPLIVAYVTFGDIDVVDAQPFPSSKDQCKNGGWRNFPGFKSLGDCVSFVATGGKNPPANQPR